MNENDYYDILNNDNYKSSRKTHTKVFGKIFESAFSDYEEAQVFLTSALNNISQRKFDEALPKLLMLESACDNEFDETAICYFLGLNHEMLENVDEMMEYYEKVRQSSRIPEFNLYFHPYYRTAKFAQRASECSKAVYYYRKALEFYDGIKPDVNIASIVSHLIYDISAVCLYMHKYDECERFLEISQQYDKSQNQHRDYVTAVLLAIQGKQEECKMLLTKMPSLLKENCQAITDAIFNGSEPHYCVVPQNRSLYENFWNSFLHNEANIRKMVTCKDFEEPEKIISEMLTKTFGFMKRTLECRIEESERDIIIKCKNYQVKSLKEEHSVLFAIKPKKLQNWEFLSVEEFKEF